MLPEKFTSLGKKFSFVASDGRHWTSIFLEKELRVSVFHEIGSDTTCTGSKEALRRKKTFLIFNSSWKFKKKSAMLSVCVQNNFAL